MRPSIRSAVLLAVVLLTPSSRDLLAQTAASGLTVAGIVTDQTGAALPAATVVLRNGAGERRTFTDAMGRFAFDRVTPGRSVLIVTMDGFVASVREIERSDVEMHIVLQLHPRLEEITVTGAARDERPIASATKTETPLLDVPQAITIVTRDAIADQAMQSMADAVRYVSGIGMAQGEGNRDTPIFRGNTSTSDFFVDGVRDDVQYFRDLYNVERVEALKGPNAMMFGRGGGGGVINRVTRQADWTHMRSVAIEGGAFAHRRVTADLGQPISDTAALRVNSMYENSGSYRRGVDLVRYGVNPTSTFALGGATVVRVGYEHFHDDRTADRGVPSFAGRPLETDASTFFGDPDASRSRVTVNALSSAVDRRFGESVVLRSRITFATYDKFYQNVYPNSAVDGSGQTVTLAAYNNATVRHNVFNQTDLVARRATGPVRHTILAGIEIGRQLTENFRRTGYFASVNSTAASIVVPVSAPVTSLPVVFRQSATDADNHGVATIAAAYAQHQVQLTRQVQAVVGLRYDRFGVDFRNNRTNVTFATTDRLLSPRAGIVYKPLDAVSVYGSYTVSFLPRAGEQLSSLSLTNQALDPERFRNYEAGTKWQIRPALVFSAATYRLDRGNIAVPDPADATRLLLVDGQRTDGLELDLSGAISRRWSVVATYAYQDGRVTRTQSAAVRAGARLAQVPRQSFSVWNKYAMTARWATGLGIVRRGNMFASTDNTVTLPGFTRMDGALFFTINDHLRVQTNVENLFDARYSLYANGNNNITPGAPRALRMTLTAGF